MTTKIKRLALVLKIGLAFLYAAGPALGQSALYVQMRSEQRQAGSIVHSERVGGQFWPPSNDGVVRTPHPDHPLGGNAVHSGSIVGVSGVAKNDAVVTYGMCEINIQTEGNGRAYATVQYASPVQFLGESPDGLRPVAIVHLAGEFVDGRIDQTNETGTVSARLIVNGGGDTSQAFANWDTSDNQRYQLYNIGGKSIAMSRAVPLGPHVTSLGLRLSGQVTAGVMILNARAWVTVIVPAGVTANYGQGVARSLLAPNINFQALSQPLILLPEARMADRSWTMHLIAAPGTPVRLQRSTDLSNWTDEITRTLASGAQSFDVPVTASDGYFRLVSP